MSKALSRMRIVGAALLLAGPLLAAPVLAHGNHGDKEFAGNQPTAVAGEQVKVPPDVQKALGLAVTAVGEQVLHSGFEANGRIEAIPGRSAEILAPVAGRVLRLAASRGQAVRRGETLLVLDSPEIRALAVQSEQAKAGARAELKQAEARLRLARSTFEREKELVDLKISARKDFQVAQSEYEQAAADLEAVRARLRLSGAQLDARLTQLGQRGVQAARDGRVTVASAVGGFVAQQSVSAGEAVAAGTPLYRVVDTAGGVWAAAQVYEKDLAQVRVGQPVEVVTAAYPGQVFKGRVDSVDPAVDPETRTLAVRAVLANPGGRLKPEMFATLRVTTSDRPAAVSVIPRSAVVEADGAQLVYVQNGPDVFEPVEVELGQLSGELIEVKSGVYPGDLVVSRRAFQLRAQALKGGIPAEDSASGEIESEKPKPESPSPGGTPWWALTFGAIGLAGAAFWAGARFAAGRNPGVGLPTGEVSPLPRSATRPRR